MLWRALCCGGAVVLNGAAAALIVPHAGLLGSALTIARLPTSAIWGHVAERAGVSQSTVSRALRSSPGARSHS